MLFSSLFTFSVKKNENQSLDTLSLQLFKLLRAQALCGCFREMEPDLFAAMHAFARWNKKYYFWTLSTRED